MDFSLTDDHLALREAVQRYCDRALPLQERGNAPSADAAAQRHADLAELGVLGLTLDPDLGGTGQGAVEAMLVAQEFGRALGGEAFLPNAVLAGPLLAELGSPAQCSRWLQAMAEGRLRLALACQEEGARHALGRVATRAVADGEGWRLDGRKTLVLGGDVADLLLVVARSGGTPDLALDDESGLSIFAVPADAPGLSRQVFRTVDAKGAAHLVLDGVRLGSDALLGTAGAAAPSLRRARDRAIAALCAESAGALEALLAQCCEHLKTRRQFGVPLAKFQALQHAVADMTIALEQLKSMACLAAMAVDDTGGDTARLVSAAKVLTAQLGRRCAMAAIQMHGAMGMTDECRIGHYAKRLIANGLLFGDAAFHLGRFAASRRSAPTTH